MSHPIHQYIHVSPDNMSSTRYTSCVEKRKGVGLLKPRPPLYVLKPVRRHALYIPSKKERFDLSMLGVTSFSRVSTFPTALILGVHFRGGEWGRRRCGSVVTCIRRGRSRYCVLKAFLRVQDKAFARVEWLSPPTYPYAPNKLVVRVRKLTGADQARLPAVIAVESIEPTAVAVISHPDNVHYFMLREKGVDRTGVVF